MANQGDLVSIARDACNEAIANHHVVELHACGLGQVFDAGGHPRVATKRTDAITARPWLDERATAAVMGNKRRCPRGRAAP